MLARVATALVLVISLALPSRATALGGSLQVSTGAVQITGLVVAIIGAVRLRRARQNTRWTGGPGGLQVEF